MAESRPGYVGGKLLDKTYEQQLSVLKPKLKWKVVTIQQDG